MNSLNPVKTLRQNSFKLDMVLIGLCLIHLFPKYTLESSSCHYWNVLCLEQMDFLLIHLLLHYFSGLVLNLARLDDLE